MNWGAPEWLSAACPTCSSPRLVLCVGAPGWQLLLPHPERTQAALRLAVQTDRAQRAQNTRARGALLEAQ